MSLQLSNAAIAPTPMALYPTMDSLNEAVQYIESQVPVDSSNQMYSLLMIYHNTLLKAVASHH